MECFGIFVTSQVQAFTCFLQKTYAFQACPRSHPKNAAVHISQRCETVKCGIDPTVQGDVRGTLIPSRVTVISSEEGADRLPRCATQFWIVMSTVDVLCNEVAHDAADQDVGGKVLAGANS